MMPSMEFGPFLNEKKEDIKKRLYDKIKELIN
jgi:hypothetical protein